MENISVCGIYASSTMAEKAVQRLQLEGFRNSDVSVLFSSSTGTKAFAHENSTKLPEGATSGGISGAAVGGALGWLAGIGMLAIPGVGPLMAAGPIMATLAGVGVGGAVGGIAGALVGLGIPEYEAKRYEGRINEGGILLSVHSDNDEWADKAETILEETGAEDISTKDEESAEETSPRSRVGNTSSR